MPLVRTYRRIGRIVKKMENFQLMAYQEVVDKFMIAPFLKASEYNSNLPRFVESLQRSVMIGLNTIRAE